jgi:heme-degrading monooxygenase HmoA
MNATTTPPAGTTPEARTAATGRAPLPGPVTLMNSFVVPPGRDDAFKALWDQTSRYFIAQPGFVGLRLHRAVGEEAAYRWVNVASWEREADYRAAHSGAEFLRLVTLPGWEEFPSSPTLYEVDTVIDPRG